MALAALAALALGACSKDSPDKHGSKNAKPGRDAAQDFGNADPDASSTMHSDGGMDSTNVKPGGCVKPGELNEFHLPECMDKSDVDARIPDLPCNPGFDEFGRPVCLDDAGIPKPPAPPACVRGGLCQELVLTGGGQLDVLFMIDDSASMREEQAALVKEMPQLIDVLTRGDRDGDGMQDFPAVKDLHIGVVSSDMGVAGISGIGGCSGLGDDGLLKNVPSATVTGCASSYPTFLSYDASLVDPTQAALDFACIGTLGTSGCGFEQQLESALKAVTPSTSDTRFLDNPPSLPATTGHADNYNKGFLRQDSLVALILVTDEDDCSARETRLFTPTQFLSSSDPLYAEPLNLRCHYNKANLFDVSRYVNGLSGIRPPGSNLVLFAAITGVPPALVDDAARLGVDFEDDAMRDAYYDGILAAPAMQETIDPTTTDNLVPSCNTATGLAYPPRRIVEVAKGFGRNSVVQSICQSSFAPAMEPIVDRITQSLTVGCLPKDLKRDSGGKVACDVIWELPLLGTPNASIQQCEERPYLSTPKDRDLRTTADGRARCLMDQVPVVVSSGSSKPKSGVEGFYYDDFSSQAVDQCGTKSDQRIVFTSTVKAPVDVRVYVDCAP